ncbi:MAG: zinc-binding dehydrogenase [Limisphaerales bacterium]
MKAAVLHGKEDVRLEEVAERPLAPGEVRIRIGAALTCGTDLKVFKRGYHARMLVPPTVFGHEMAGEIVETRSAEGGARNENWRVGERVVVANSAPCDDCDACEWEQHNLCDDLLFLNGAYAESIIVPARLVEKNLLRLRPGTAFRDAALTEPLACVVQGIEDSQLAAGQRVLIIGAGPIGLMFVALARHLGCEVAVAGRGEARLQAARRLGAGEIYDVGAAGDIVKTVTARLPKPNFDTVIEAVGKPEAWEAAVKLVRKGGAVNFFGGCPAGTSVSLDTGLIHYSNLTLRASFHHTPRTIRRALEFIESGVIRAADFVDGECALSELPALFARMTAGNRVVKTFVDVTR